MTQARIAVAGTHSGVGKTTITLGIMAALMKRGLAVQGFKVGPDYIDPSYHSFLTGRPSRNLDSWMLGLEGVRDVFEYGSRGADLSVVEGVMGLYDGKDPLSNHGSTAEVVMDLAIPVLLVIDGSAMARSAAALVRGYQVLEPEVPIAGVITNRVGSIGHYRLLQAAIEKECGIPVVGYLPKQSEINIPERHLGLLPAMERGELNALFDKLADYVSSTINLDFVLELANLMPETNRQEGHRVLFARVDTQLPKNEIATIAVAKDSAFNFYYPENLELLEQMGARLVFFSPIKGETIPAQADGLYLGGGFPEEFAAVLHAQTDMLADVRTRVLSGLPTYAECGGYMFLARTLSNRQGDTYNMVGVIPASITMTDKLVGFGYREVEPMESNWLMERGETAKGHEFHYSAIAYEVDENAQTGQTAAYRRVGLPVGSPLEGFARDNVVAGYTHLHFGSNPMIAKRFVEACAAFGRRRSNS